MLKIASDFYKDLFIKEDRNGFNMNPNFFSEEEKVTPDENNILEASFSEEEVKKAVFDSILMELQGLMGSLFFSINTFGN